MSDDNGNGDGPPDDDYKVGRGKPPRHTQFKKGKSGNPRGRPKGAKGTKTQIAKMDDLFTEVMLRPIRVTKNGTSVMMTTQEAIVEKTIADALAGDYRARREVLARIAAMSGQQKAQEPSDPIDHRAAVHAKLASMHKRMHDARNEERLRQGLLPLPDEE